MSDEIVNKVAKAQIEQIDLKDFLFKGEIKEIDLKDQLWNELVLKESDFRAWVKEHDWDSYSDQVVCVFCSADAIVPAWAFMLVTAELKDPKKVVFGSKKDADKQLFFEAIANWDVSDLTDKRVMVKGCSDIPEPNQAYVEFTAKLLPVVKSLMFGEPCSAVPVYKKR
ncbi:MAG: hypothetical protein BM555_04520 [Crocinitomix sp. MedPE-SWsnd]|nr:MAG: hypothetical protein BM555_04520 [Crocinitomix sp. MedPE-SWsnd]